MNSRTRYLLYGIVLETDWQLQTPLRHASVSDRPDLRFDVVSSPPAEGGWATVKRVMMPDGEVYIEAGSIAGRPVIRIPNVGDAWLVEPDHIVFHLVRPEHDFHVEVALLGVVMADWLERSGRSALHGAAACRAGISVAFLGPNGTGKTSLALALQDQNWALLTDDLVPISFDGATALVHPSFPQVRLWPEHALQMLGSISGLERAHPYYEKLRVGLSADQSASQAEVLTVIYLPRRQREQAHPTFESVDGTPAFFRLMANSFVPDLLDVPDRREAWFERLASILERVPVYSVVYPDDVSLLPDVASAVAHHAVGLAAPSHR